MAKYIPLSLVILTIALAGYMAGKPRGKQALRTVQISIALYILLWGYMCINVYTQYVFIE